MSTESYKAAAAEAALSMLPVQCLLGVGTGSTTNYFIDKLASTQFPIRGAIPSSLATEARLKKYGIPIASLADGDPDVYVDGADRFNALGELIKGGGGAQTREKVIATAAHQFICIVDVAKYSGDLASFPLAVEVLPMARSYVARVLMQMGGTPFYRENFLTDNGNVILDVQDLDFRTPLALEAQLDLIPGLVGHGLFAHRAADLLLIGGPTGVERQWISSKAPQA